jgi:hypothetical protein
MIFFVCYFAFAEDVVVPDGSNAGLWAMGLTAASAVVLVVTVKLALYVNNWTVWQAGIMLLSVFVFFLFLVLVAVLSVSTVVVSFMKVSLFSGHFECFDDWSGDAGADVAHLLAVGVLVRDALGCS